MVGGVGAENQTVWVTLKVRRKAHCSGRLSSSIDCKHGLPHPPRLQASTHST